MPELVGQLVFCEEEPQGLEAAARAALELEAAAMADLADLPSLWDPAQLAGEPLIPVMCAEHVKGRYFDAHQKDFEDLEHRTLMNIEFEYYKACPLLGLVKDKALLWTALMAKWDKNHGETRMSQLFDKAWRTRHATRVEVNAHALVSGGLYVDNNGVEATNRWIKEFLATHLSAHKRMSLINWVNSKVAGSLPQLVSFTSRKDMSYDRLFNAEVHSAKFFAEVAVRLSRDSGVSPCTVTFPYRGVTGRIIITPMHTLREARDYKVDIGDLAETKRALSNGWLVKFKELVKTPETVCAEEMANNPALAFDNLISWARAFYIMTPITEEAYAISLRTRLHNQGLTVVPSDQIQTGQSKGFMECGCKVFMHYAWCKHACEDACRKGIIELSADCWPAEMNPISFKRQKV